MSSPKIWSVGLFGFLVAVFAIASGGSETAQGFMVLWAVFCTIGIAVAAKRLQHQARRIYGLLALSGGLVVVGAIARTLIGEAMGVDQPLPSAADFLTVPGYLCFAFVALSIHRIRATHANLDAWLDAWAITIAAVLVFWAGFLADFITTAETSSGEIAISTFYNLIVFGAAATLVRIGASPGHRPFSYNLLGVAGLSFVVADIAGTISASQGATLYITLALSPIVYGFMFAASWHSSAADIADVPEPEEERVSLFRFGITTLAIATPALSTIFPVAQAGIGRIGTLILSSVIALLVVARVLRLLAAQRRVMSTESRLVETLSHLTSLGGANEIAHALPAAVSRIFGSDSELVISDERAGAESVELHEDLAPGIAGPSYARLLPQSHDPARRRIFASFIRDAGAITSARQASEALAIQRSEAEANKRVAANERRFRALVQNSSDVVAVINVDGSVSYISESCEKVLGYSPSRFIGNSLEWIAHHNDWDFARDYMQATMSGTESRREHEVRALHSDGSIKLFEYLITDMRDVDGIEGLVVNLTDVTEKRKLERNLRDAETTDPLTLLLNRTAFIRAADTSIRRASIESKSVAMAVINLDDFRLINEGYGTSTADEVLVELSHRVRQSVRSEDTVARLNGDEFGILMPSGYTDVEAEHVVERILAEVTEPVDVTGRTVALRATAGLVSSSDGSATGISLLRDADTALDAAKQTQRGGLVRFNEAMGEEISERVELRNLLHDAIATNKLRLAFQPIVDMETGLIVSMEALARWHDEARGDIGPATFIPIAESTGMISELGEWALRTACNHLVEWAAQGFDDFTVSVNMSGHQLREESIIAQVSAVLSDTGADPSRITIEITESVLIDDTDFIAERIRALRDLGLQLAIDDFGTGYSSLSYLRRYEFDVLKIDRSFVIPLASDANKREREIVNAMIKLAQALGAVTVAEGIEESEEYAVLRTLGCDHAQGYLFWHPVESDEVIEILDSQIAGNTAA